MADNVFTDELEDTPKIKPTNARASREAEARDNNTRPTSWKPPELLPEIEEMPGYEVRWCRAEAAGRADPKNMSSKAREGWEPVSSEEQPRAAMHFSSNARSASGTIEFGGLVLCKRPVEFGQQRTAYYRAKTLDQTRAVDQNLMKQNDSRMPLFRENNTQVKIGQ